MINWMGDYDERCARQPVPEFIYIKCAEIRSDPDRQSLNTDRDCETPNMLYPQPLVDATLPKDDNAK